MPEPITPFPSTALTAPTSAISPPARAAAGDFDALIADRKTVAAPAAIAAAALTVDPAPLADVSPDTPEPPPTDPSLPSPDLARPVPRHGRAATGKTLPAAPPPRAAPTRAEDPPPEAGETEAAADPRPDGPAPTVVSPPIIPPADNLPAPIAGTVPSAPGQAPDAVAALATPMPDKGIVAVPVTEASSLSAPTGAPPEPARPEPARPEPATRGTAAPRSAPVEAATPSGMADAAPARAGVEALRVARAPAPPVPMAGMGPTPAIDPAIPAAAAILPAGLRSRLHAAPRPDAPRAPHPFTPGMSLPQATDRLLRARANTAFAEPAPELSSPAMTGAALSAPAQATAPAPAEVSAALAQPIETQARDWRTQMLDRIERFAAAEPAPGRETRITLSPDALGEVAVRLRETDRGIEVVLDAAPEARALLAEAAPRLTELAESRGLRLTLSQPGTGEGSGDRPQPPPRHQNDATLPNRRAAPRGAADTPTDERIA